MNYVVDKRFQGESVNLVGPFDTAEQAYEWIDRASKIDPSNCLGIDKYVHDCTTYFLRRLLSAQGQTMITIQHDQSGSSVWGSDDWSSALYALGMRTPRYPMPATIGVCVIGKTVAWIEQADKPFPPRVVWARYSGINR